jgi:hypothetical protein
MTWQTFETAPKTGERILAAWKSGREPSVVWWNAKEGYHSFTTGSFDRFDIPDQYAPDWFSHWVPIPAAPSA